jgi:16S rRNA (uracil1498-N3)-methyltransferase
MARDARLPVVATFFAPEQPTDGATVTLGEDAAHHARVKRLEAGDAVRLVDGAGTVATGRIVRVGKSQLAIDVESTAQADHPSDIHLLVPIADRDRMLWLAEKSAEMGVASWRPVLWRRSRSVQGRGEGSTFQMKVRSRMISALEQSGNPWLPAIFPEATVERALAAAPSGTRLLLDAAGDALRSARLAAPVTIALGPEGGLEDDEREAFVGAGFSPVSIAGNVLRFETAGIAALALVHALVEEPTEER